MNDPQRRQNLMHRWALAGLSAGLALAAAGQTPPPEAGEPVSTRGSILPREEPLSPRPPGAIPIGPPRGPVQQAAPTLDPARTRLAQVSFISVPQREPRVLKKHDLITVIVREQSEMKSDGKTDLKKDFSMNAKLQEFISLELANWAIRGGAQGSVPPGIRLNGQRDFSGDGSVDRTDSFTTRVTAEVVDVKPNGNVVLQAMKRIKHDEEEQAMILTGVCRAEDITPDNTVLSTQLYDMVLEKSTRGAVTDTNKRGLIPKVLDKLNPF
jgi:flagellar L-ring protein precursor FlgH